MGKLIFICKICGIPHLVQESFTQLQLYSNKSSFSLIHFMLHMMLLSFNCPKCQCRHDELSSFSVAGPLAPVQGGFYLPYCFPERQELLSHHGPMGLRVTAHQQSTVSAFSCKAYRATMGKISPGRVTQKAERDLLL